MRTYACNISIYGCTNVLFLVFVYTNHVWINIVYTTHVWISIVYIHVDGCTYLSRLRLQFQFIHLRVDVFIYVSHSCSLPRFQNLFIYVILHSVFCMWMYVSYLYIVSSVYDFRFPLNTQIWFQI